MGNENTSLMMMVIIAVVAIVAIVALTMNSGNHVPQNSVLVDDNTAGHAKFKPKIQDYKTYSSPTMNAEEEEEEIQPVVMPRNTQMR